MQWQIPFPLTQIAWMLTSGNEAWWRCRAILYAAAHQPWWQWPNILNHPVDKLIAMFHFWGTKAMNTTAHKPQRKTEVSKRRNGLSICVVTYQSLIRFQRWTVGDAAYHQQMNKPSSLHSSNYYNITTRPPYAHTLKYPKMRKEFF